MTVNEARSAVAVVVGPPPGGVLFGVARAVPFLADASSFGVHRSTYYAWKRQVDRHGLEMLRPRERQPALTISPPAWQ